MNKIKGKKYLGKKFFVDTFFRFLNEIMKIERKCKKIVVKYFNKLNAHILQFGFESGRFEGGGNAPASGFSCQNCEKLCIYYTIENVIFGNSIFVNEFKEYSKN